MKRVQVIEFGGLEVRRFDEDELVELWMRKVRELVRKPYEAWTDDEVEFAQWVKGLLEKFENDLERDGFVDLGAGAVAYKALH